MNDSIFIALQRLTPQHALSRSVGKLARCETPWIKNRFITWFVDRYDVDMSQAEYEDPLAYPSFNAFFTRALKAEARPIAADENVLVSPADGVISQLGAIKQGRIVQAKGQNFSVQELLADEDLHSEQYTEGAFATIYLSPKDYHRVHMPCAGELTKMVYIPGQLFSVNHTTAAHVPRLFARNERLVCHFEGPQGPFCLVLVGAMIVAGIETVWAGTVTPLRRQIKATHYGAEQFIKLAKGQEMGRFLLGSTVIALYPKNTVQWDAQLSVGSKLNMGQTIARWQ